MALPFFATSRSCMARLLTAGTTTKIRNSINIRMENTSSVALPQYNYETLLVSRPKEFVVHVQMNRPQKLNAMNKAFWKDIRECFQQLSDDPECRVVILSGSGRMFTAGLDLTDMGDIIAQVTSSDDVARKAKTLKKLISSYQDSFSAIETCCKPVIAAVHNACVGGGVNMISSCDIRYCTKDAWFQIKEVELGLAADVGALQRFPKIVGNSSIARELALTARKFYADEAERIGFVGRVFEDKDTLMQVSMEMATLIASKSPVAVQGTKLHLNYSRDHTAQEGLDLMSFWNMTMLQSEDLMKAAMASMDKSGPPPVFSKL